MSALSMNRSGQRGLAIASVRHRSFDRQFACDSLTQRPDRYRLIEGLAATQPRITRGSGVSYVAASFGADALVQELGAFNRLLAFDHERGLLTVEAGARIGDVVRFAVRHGFFLSVSPGHPAASIGGCIAADVHGKNPARDGTFRTQLIEMEIFHPCRGLVRASPHSNSHLFNATCGGFGLTGTILTATLQLTPAPAAFTIERIPVANFVEAEQVLLAHANASLLYGWHNGQHGRFGRGVIRVGHGLESTLDKITSDKVAADLADSIQPLPWRVWNRYTLRLANAWLEIHWCQPGQEILPTPAALFPFNANRLYFSGFGHTGLLETQWLIPHSHFAAFCQTLEELIMRHRPLITLISSKLFSGAPANLALNGTGIALSLQLAAPQQQRTFLDALTELALNHQARPNPMKDYSLEAATLHRALPDLDNVRARIAAFNPDRLYRSELSRRLAL